MTKRPHTADFIEATAFFFIVAAMCISCYYIYVKPANEARSQIIDCMYEEGDMSEDTYDWCFDKLAAQRK